MKTALMAQADDGSDERRLLFREAMPRVAYSVCAVTTSGPCGTDGMMVTAMVPVSDAGPDPVLLVCLCCGSRVLPTLLGNGSFCVNVLGEAHSGTADRLAGRDGSDRASWFVSPSGTSAPMARPPCTTLSPAWPAP